MRIVNLIFTEDSGDLEFDEVFGILKKRSFYNTSSEDVRLIFNF
jgi:hypothetical protein